MAEREPIRYRTAYIAPDGTHNLVPIDPRSVARPARFVPPTPLTRRERLDRWREQHYVGDQLIRVSLLAAGALVGLTVFLGAILAVVSMFAGVLSMGLGTAILVGLALALVVAAAKAPGKSPRQSSGDYGFHYTKCDHK